MRPSSLVFPQVALSKRLLPPKLSLKGRARSQQPELPAYAPVGIAT